MLVKIINIFIVIFLESIILSESIKVENEVQIAELIEKIVAEKTSELTSKLRSLEGIVMNQQRRIDRLEKQDKRNERTIKDLIRTLADIRQEMKTKDIEADTEEDKTDNAHSDNQFGSNVLNETNVQNSSENETSAVQAVKHIRKSRRRRQVEIVAFSVYLSHNIDHMSIGHHIVFDKALTNDGAGYNINTGIFTTPVTGLYLFTFSFNDHYRISVIKLVVDGTNIVDIVDSPANNIEVCFCLIWLCLYSYFSVPLRD